MTNHNFQIFYTVYNPEQEPLRETLCTLGNGYFMTRGAHESSKAGGKHYPGTYLAGGYNRLETKIAGQILENEDLVNWPNWLYLSFKINDGEWFSLDGVQILDYRQTLDLQSGLLRYTLRFRDNFDRITKLESTRFVSIKSEHLAGIQWILTPENWSGTVTVHSAIDGNVTNCGVKRYRDLNGNHLEPVKSGRIAEESVYLEVKTKQSQIHMAIGTQTLAFHENMPLPVQRETIESEQYIAQELIFDCQAAHPVTLEKIVAVYTSKDMAISEPVTDVTHVLLRYGTFSDILTSHINAWKQLWNRFDIQIKGDDQSQLLLRLHIFHILQTASPNTYDLDVGVPSRGLHGEAYRGHILWDELFVFPFLNFRNPQLTREFLLYRYRRLDMARFLAKKAGYQGAMFPWQSGSNGREEAQKIHLNPNSGRWVPDHSHLQHHVNSAIVYNIWQYFQATDDKEFINFFGAEVVFEIARFWASIARYNPERDRFEIHGIIGPDEYHTSYPGSERPGINNNAYTNIMAAWVIMRALDILDMLSKTRKKELLEDLRIDSEHINRWHQICEKMFVPFTDGIIEQFEGYNKLEELNWERYHKLYGTEYLRLDRILESENDSINKYKASKQADVLMLFYLFSAEEMKETLRRLGYEFDTGSIPQIIEYYHNRTAHGSTLSRLVFSWVLSRSHREQSWHFYEKALISDFKDVQGGTTAEGIHLGAMAGTVDMIQRCYTGLEVKGDVLVLNPRLPANLTEIRQKIRYRGHWIDMVVNNTSLKISFEKGWGNPVKIQIGGHDYVFSDEITEIFKI